MSTAEILNQADHHYNNQAWHEALRAYTTLVSHNPYNGKYWYRLGEIHYHLKNHKDAIQAFNQCIPLGYDVPESMYYLARNYALLNQSEEAIQWLEKVAVTYHGFRFLNQLDTESDFECLRTHDRFHRLLPSKLPDTVSKVEGWSTDLEYMTSYMEQTHYHLFRVMRQEAWEQAKEDLKRKISKSNDNEIIVEFMRLVAGIGDGHTIVVPPFSGQFQFHKLPVIFYEFHDGLFIQAAAPECKEIVGSRVLQIGNMPVEQALRMVEPIIPRDNQMTVKWLRPTYLACPEILHGLKISDHPDQVELVVKKDFGGQSKMRLKSSDPMEKIVDHYRERLAQDDWVVAWDTQSTPPLWLKNPNDAYWFEYLPEKKLVYFQYNVVSDKPDESIKDFSRRLFKFIGSNDVDALIIDLRLNDGGNGSLNQAILHDIIRCTKINQKGRLFTIIGRGTFSAAQQFATELELHTQTLFVGEPTGSCPNHIGEGNYITLPYSKLYVNASPLMWQTSKAYDERIWIAPDIVAEQTSEDFKSNTDPAINAIFTYLGKGG